MKKIVFLSPVIFILAGLGIFLTREEPALPEGRIATKVVVYKGQRRMHLYAHDTLLKTYIISLGDQPEGHKQKEGDERTPEGNYTIDWRNPKSVCHLSLHISYPNRKDKEFAGSRGWSPGGNVMIHGILNGMGWVSRLHRFRDWTNGCIAVTDMEMEEIWRAVPNGTPIEIHR